MFRISFIIFMLSCLNCSAQNKLQVKTITSQYVNATRTNADGKQVSYMQQKATIDILQPEIQIQSFHKNNLNYQLQGHISSGGLSINKVKKIRTEILVINDTLFVKHFAEIKRIPGKEGANVMGYNYSKTEMVKVPNDIAKIRIELYTEKQNQQNSNITKLVADKEYDLTTSNKLK